MKSNPPSLLQTGNRISGIARSIESVSLELLRDIDETVESLNDMTKIMEGFASMIQSNFAHDLAVVEGEYLDPQDEALDAIERSVAHYKTYLTALVRQRATIDQDNRLKGHHCTALHDAYEKTMETVVSLIDALESARVSIIKHDLAAEPRGKEFKTVEGLIASLRG